MGKSSLINSLCSHKGLAKTSSTPGKTLLVNHFLINDSWYLVDLPGYGYAKISQAGRVKLHNMINEYINESQEMVLLFVLLDSRHSIQKIDLEFLLSLGAAGIPFSIIFTKADKPKRGELQTNVKRFLSRLSESWEELPPYFVTSSQSGKGREEVLGYVQEVMQMLQAPQVEAPQE